MSLPQRPWPWDGFEEMFLRIERVQRRRGASLMIVVPQAMLRRPFVRDQTRDAKLPLVDRFGRARLRQPSWFPVRTPCVRWHQSGRHESLRPPGGDEMTRAEVTAAGPTTPRNP